MEDYVHLHVHTDYSVLDGQSKVTRLVDKAVADGMKGMAVTDHGVMFGIKEFSDYCAKVNKGRKEKGEAPFKPVFGCEMYVARRTMHDKDKSMHDNSGYHLIVLAKNYHVTRTSSSSCRRHGWTDIIINPVQTGSSSRSTTRT